MRNLRPKEVDLLAQSHTAWAHYGAAWWLLIFCCTLASTLSEHLTRIFRLDSKVETEAGGPQEDGPGASAILHTEGAWAVRQTASQAFPDQFRGGTMVAPLTPILSFEPYS